MSVSLSAGLAEMLRSAANQQQEPRTFPMKEAQRAMLDDVLAHAEPFPRFTRGDPVHYHAGQGPLLKEVREGLIFQFWRYLDHAAPEDQLRMHRADASEIQTLPNIDCLIVNFDGRSLTYLLACSYLLHPGDAE